MTATNGTSAGDAVIHMASSLLGDNVTLNISNSTLASVNNSQGLAAHANNGSGIGHSD